MISISKIKTNICRCVSQVKYTFTGRPKINFAAACDRFDKRDYVYKIMQIPNKGINACLCRETLKNIPEFTLSHYMRLYPEQIYAIRGMVSYDTAENAQIIVNNSKIIKQFLDNKYGEHKYVFVAADVTYSQVAKCLEYLGVESAAKPADDLAYHFKKIIFCSGRESKNEVKQLKKTFNSKNHIFMEITENLRNNRDIKNNPKLEAAVNDFEQKRRSFRFEGFGDKPPLSEWQKRFQFCLLDIINS